MRAIMTRCGILSLLVFVVLCVFHAALAVVAAAQDATAAPVLDWKAILDMVLKAVVPAVWVAFGPIAVAFITKGVNKVAVAYVPRQVQVVLSGLLTAGLAGLTGGDMASGLVQGGLSQTLAATNPSTLLTDPPKR